MHHAVTTFFIEPPIILTNGSHNTLKTCLISISTWPASSETHHLTPVSVCSECRALMFGLRDHLKMCTSQQTIHTNENAHKSIHCSEAWIHFSRHSSHWQEVKNFTHQVIKQLIQNIKRVKTLTRQASGFVFLLANMKLLAFGEWLSTPLDCLFMLVCK
jgi:hypothetical protein